MSVEVNYIKSPKPTTVVKDRRAACGHRFPPVSLVISHGKTTTLMMKYLALTVRSGRSSPHRLGPPSYMLTITQAHYNDNG